MVVVHVHLENSFSLNSAISIYLTGASVITDASFFYAG